MKKDKTSGSCCSHHTLERKVLTAGKRAQVSECETRGGMGDLHVDSLME